MPANRTAIKDDYFQAASWDVSRVVEWLIDINPVFSAYVPVVMGQNINGAALLALNPHSLQSIGIRSEMHRSAIAAHLDELKRMQQENDFQQPGASPDNSYSSHATSSHHQHQQQQQDEHVKLHLRLTPSQLQYPYSIDTPYRTRVQLENLEEELPVCYNLISTHSAYHSFHTLDAPSTGASDYGFLPPASKRTLEVTVHPRWERTGNNRPVSDYSFSEFLFSNLVDIDCFRLLTDTEPDTISPPRSANSYSPAERQLFDRLKRHGGSDSMLPSEWRSDAHLPFFPNPQSSPAQPTSRTSASSSSSSPSSSQPSIYGSLLKSWSSQRFRTFNDPSELSDDCVSARFKDQRNLERIHKGVVESYVSSLLGSHKILVQAKIHRKDIRHSGTPESYWKATSDPENNPAALVDVSFYAYLNCLWSDGGLDEKRPQGVQRALPVSLDHIRTGFLRVAGNSYWSSVSPLLPSHSAQFYSRVDSADSSNHLPFIYQQQWPRSKEVGKRLLKQNRDFYTVFNQHLVHRANSLQQMSQHEAEKMLSLKEIFAPGRNPNQTPIELVMPPERKMIRSAGHDGSEMPRTFAYSDEASGSASFDTQYQVREEAPRIVHLDAQKFLRLFRAVVQIQTKFKRMKKIRAQAFYERMSLEAEEEQRRTQQASSSTLAARKKKRMSGADWIKAQQEESRRAQAALDRIPLRDAPQVLPAFSFRFFRMLVHIQTAFKRMKRAATQRIKLRLLKAQLDQEQQLADRLSKGRDRQKKRQSGAEFLKSQELAIGKPDDFRIMVTPPPQKPQSWSEMADAAQRKADGTKDDMTIAKMINEEQNRTRFSIGIFRLIVRLQLRMKQLRQNAQRKLQAKLLRAQLEEQNKMTDKIKERRRTGDKSKRMSGAEWLKKQLVESESDGLGAGATIKLRLVDSSSGANTPRSAISKSSISPKSQPQGGVEKKKRSVKWADSMDDDAEEISIRPSQHPPMSELQQYKRVNQTLAIKNIRIFRLIVRIQQRFHALRARAQEKVKHKALMQMITSEKDLQDKLKGKRDRSKRMSGAEWIVKQNQEDETRRKQFTMEHQFEVHESVSSGVIEEKLDSSAPTVQRRISHTRTQTPFIKVRGLSQDFQTSRRDSNDTGVLSLRMLRVIGRIQRSFHALKIRAQERIRARLLKSQMETDRMMQEKLKRAQSGGNKARRQTGAEWLKALMDADAEAAAARTAAKDKAFQQAEKENRMLAAHARVQSQDEAPRVSNIRVWKLIVRIQQKFHLLKMKAQEKLRRKLVLQQMLTERAMQDKLKNKEKNRAKRMSGSQWIAQQIRDEEVRRQQFTIEPQFEVHESVNSGFITETLTPSEREKRGRNLLSPTRKAAVASPRASGGAFKYDASSRSSSSNSSSASFTFRTLRMIARVQQQFHLLKVRAQQRIRDKLLRQQLESERELQDKLKGKRDRSKRMTGGEWVLQQQREAIEADSVRRTNPRPADPYAHARRASMQTPLVSNLRIFAMIVRLQAKMKNLRKKAQRKMKEKLLKSRWEQEQAMADKLKNVGKSVAKKYVEPTPASPAAGRSAWLSRPSVIASVHAPPSTHAVTISNLRVFQMIVRIQQRFHALKLQAKNRLREKLLASQLRQQADFKEKLEMARRAKASGKPSPAVSRRVTGSDWLKHQLEEAQRTIAALQESQRTINALVQKNAQQAAQLSSPHRQSIIQFRPQEVHSFSSNSQVQVESLQQLQAKPAAAAAAVAAQTFAAPTAYGYESSPEPIYESSAQMMSPYASAPLSNSSDEWLYTAVDEAGNEFVLKPIPMAEHQRQQQQSDSGYYRPSPPPASALPPRPPSATGFTPSPPANPRLVNIKLVERSRVSPRTVRVMQQGGTSDGQQTQPYPAYPSPPPTAPQHHVPVSHPHYAALTASMYPTYPPPHAYPPYGYPPYPYAAPMPYGAYPPYAPPPPTHYPPYPYPYAMPPAPPQQPNHPQQQSQQQQPAPPQQRAAAPYQQEYDQQPLDEQEYAADAYDNSQPIDEMEQEVYQPAPRSPVRPSSRQQMNVAANSRPASSMNHTPLPQRSAVSPAQIDVQQRNTPSPRRQQQQQQQAPQQQYAYVQVAPPAATSPVRSARGVRSSPQHQQQQQQQAYYSDEENEASYADSSSSAAGQELLRQKRLRRDYIRWTQQQPPQQTHKSISPTRRSGNAPVVARTASVNEYADDDFEDAPQQQHQQSQQHQTVAQDEEGQYDAEEFEGESAQQQPAAPMMSPAKGGWVVEEKEASSQPVLYSRTRQAAAASAANARPRSAVMSQVRKVKQVPMPQPVSPSALRSPLYQPLTDDDEPAAIVQYGTGTIASRYGLGGPYRPQYYIANKARANGGRSRK